jgi:hypothetical protein
MTVVVMLGLGPQAWGLVTGDGRGKPGNDCLIGLDGLDPGIVAGRRIECTDCDPACDRDGTSQPNGSCTFRLAVCLNYPSLDGCDPATLKRVKAKPTKFFRPEVQVPPPPLDAGFVCGASTDGPLVRTRKKGTRPGKQRIKLLARSDGKPSRKDADVFTLVCNPLPPGQACPGATTTCGNGVADPGETCDGTDLGGETCVTRGFMDGTLDCTPGCIFDLSGCVPAQAACRETMDATCPNDAPQCGATFAGGQGCRFERKGNCYDTGSRAYKVRGGEMLTITMETDIVGLEVFFAGEGSATGTMTFRDAGGNIVGSPLTTNGNCLAMMPQKQQVSFPTPVHTIDVTASGGPVWIDTFRINP